MNDTHVAGLIQILLLVLFLAVAIFFLLTQVRTLDSIRPENRCMSPGQVWLQLIPLFGLFYQFSVIERISDSIRNELNSPTGDSIFAEETIPSNHRPTYSVARSYAILFCISIIPFPLLKELASLAGLVLWVVYWVQLAGYKKRIRERIQLLGGQ
ncbi:hypothetical protein A3860_20075 [Niastella vici]|uniref:DUF4328 domain-containing protein n=1 Tax=Niastella vici TaxID=1703345 RepID=A0A1V9G1D6_9BACT|nr:hypothetical protein [Niastella vici]OQP64276.1 hypothetical protein A3860_20075 [Niastella vici]